MNVQTAPEYRTKPPTFNWVLLIPVVLVLAFPLLIAAVYYL